MIVWFLWVDASAATRSVGAGQPYATIAAAVAAAAPGDTIEIRAGTYVESVSTQEALTFVGVGDPVWSPAAGFNPALQLVGADATLSGITFDGVGGRCVDITSADVTIEAADFEDCSVAVDAYDVVLVVDGVSFLRGGRGVVQAFGSSRVIRSTFRRVGQTAVDVQGAGFVRILGNTFTDNGPGTGGAGGAVLVDPDGTDNVVGGNVFCGNASTAGSALRISDFAVDTPANEILVIENLFQENDSRGNGAMEVIGYVYVYGGQPVRVDLHRNTFLGNADTGGGGSSGSQLYVGSRSRVTMDSNVVASGQGGPAMQVSGGTASGDYNLFHANTSSHLAGMQRSGLGANTLWDVDPLWTSVTLDGDCGNDDLTPLAGSPLPDGGNPARPIQAGGPPDLGYSRY